MQRHRHAAVEAPNIQVYTLSPEIGLDWPALRATLQALSPRMYLLHGIRGVASLISRKADSKRLGQAIGRVQEPPSSIHSRSLSLTHRY